METKDKNKWWVWIIVIVVIWWGYNSWYKTRISSFIPQSGTYTCPDDKPIKGNSQSGIYHVPGGQYYSKTMPEKCFSSESDAVEAGYRKSKR